LTKSRVGKELDLLETEKRNSRTKLLSLLSTIEILRLINSEDRKIASAVGKEIPNITRAVDSIVRQINSGGKLYYVGAGTSGRLGVLDAAELLPTFGAGRNLVRAIIAGGRNAMFSPIEGAEDSKEEAVRVLRNEGLHASDVLLGISASGRTPFVVGALEYARNQIKAHTIALTVNPNSPITTVARISICPLTGPEVLTGSTRMKAGTAQKLVLNMISTAVMVKLGRTHGNLMVKIKPYSEKLVERMKRIIVSETGLNQSEAGKKLIEAGMDVKAAIVIAKTGIDCPAAKKFLARSNGSIDEAVGLVTAKRKPELK
jgi:N-acetylmuramic acid 6-phosphate etherase